MDCVAPSDFKHTTLTRYPQQVIGITLLDEEPGFTGIYLRDRNGGLWPCRTVSHIPAEHHTNVVEAWLAGPGVHQDKRSRP